jgi:LPS-assembly lipoprotein
MSAMRRLMRPLFAAIALTATGSGLSGCVLGFTPLYAAPGVVPSLEAVDVQTPRTTDQVHQRVGYLLREQINDELGRKLDVSPRYRLTLTYEEGRIPRGLRINNVANLYEIVLTVTYTLSDISTGRALYSGRASASVSYNAPDPPYASVAAEQDGEIRAANQAAIRIRLDLSRYFHRQAAAG